MSLVKQVEDLKAAGRSDSQIVSDLRNQGFMPREIEDALSQFAVKSAVSQEYNASSDSNMQQSIMTAPPAPAPSNLSPPSVPSPNYQGAVQSDYQQQSPDQNYYEGYSSQAPSADSYPQYSYSQSSGSEAFSEIAEQVFDQKIVKIKGELSKLEDFKSDVDGKMGLLKERIKRIESIIDTLQDSIIRKIGEYGQNIQDLGNDLRTTQDSFSKVIQPLSRSISTPKISRPRVSRPRKKPGKK